VSERTESYILVGLRICGAVVMGLIGWSVGSSVAPVLPSPLDHETFAQVATMTALGALGTFAFPMMLGRPLIQL